MNALHGSLASIDDGLWVDREPIRILGTRLSATMAVLRLADGALLVYSPLSLTPARRAAVEAVGAVAHLYAPNLFHHLSIGEWAAAFPQARVHAPANLSEKRPDLRIDRVHGSFPEPDFEALVDEIPIDGFRLAESVLVYRPARTLIVADLVHNVGRPRDRWSRFYTRTMGFYDRVALSRMIRWTAFSDRTAARRSLDSLLALSFDRVIVGHGAPIASDGRNAIEAAYSWLRPI